MLSVYLRPIAAKVFALAFAAGASVSCSAEERLPFVLNVGGPAITRVPYIIAYEEGLFAKHGLELELRLRPRSEDGELKSRVSVITGFLRNTGLQDAPEADVNTNGLGPGMLQTALSAGRNHYVVGIASTDCAVRGHIIARQGIGRLGDLKGGRIGVSSFTATLGMQARILAERMGWDPVQDITIVEDGSEDIGLLLNGSLDAMIVNERTYLAAMREGLTVLADTSEWNESLAGNSARVPHGWLDDEINREKARRFLRALSEGIAIFHRQPDIAIAAIEKWYGFSREDAEFAYSRGAWIPRKPYPCRDGLIRTTEIYDSNAVRHTDIEDFLDEILMRELDESGFIDALYR